MIKVHPTIICHPAEDGVPQHYDYERCPVCDARHNKFAEEQRERYKKAVADFPAAEGPVNDLPFLWRFKEPFDPTNQNFSRDWRQGIVNSYVTQVRDHLGELYIYINDRVTVPYLLVKVDDIEWRYSEDLLTKFVDMPA